MSSDSQPAPPPGHPTWNFEITRHDESDIALVQDRLARLWDAKNAEDTLHEAAEKLSQQAEALASKDEGSQAAATAPKRPRRKRHTRVRLPDRSKVSREDKAAALALARKKGLL